MLMADLAAPRASNKKYLEESINVSTRENALRVKRVAARAHEILGEETRDLSDNEIRKPEHYNNVLDKLTEETGWGFAALVDPLNDAAAALHIRVDIISGTLSKIQYFKYRP